MENNNPKTPTATRIYFGSRFKALKAVGKTISDAYRWWFYKSPLLIDWPHNYSNDDPRIQDAFINLEIAIEKDIWKIADALSISFNMAEQIYDLRHDIHWSQSREDRLLERLKSNDLIIPTIEELREAELMTQDLGIEIRIADVKVRGKRLESLR